MKIFENEFAEILHDEELNILSLVYKKQVQKDDLQNLYQCIKN